MAYRWALLAALLAAAASPAQGLYFYITEGTKRCFIEEVPGETLVMGTYKNPDFIPFGQPGFDGIVSWNAGSDISKGSMRCWANQSLGERQPALGGRRGRHVA
jgi:hypothetical protein